VNIDQGNTAVSTNSNVVQIFKTTFGAKHVKSETY